MEFSITVLLFGWTLEMIGICIVYVSSARLSNWILDNWMKSLPDGFLKEKKDFKRKNDSLLALGIILIVSGLTYQLMATSDWFPQITI